jgi:hypothetical protein
MKAEVVSETEDADSSDVQDSLLGEGEGGKSPLFDELREIIREKDALLEYSIQSQKYIDEIGPLLEEARKTASEMEISLRGDSIIETLRTAELHGDGVTYHSPNQEQAMANRAPGDLCVDRNGDLWMIVAVDEKGRITKITGAVADPQNLKQFSPARLRYVWTPDKHARKWKVPSGSVNYRGDISNAMAYLIRLWGEKESPSGRDLSRPAALLAEVLDQAGIVITELQRKKWWNKWNLDDVEIFCNRHGKGTRLFKEDINISLGDLLRMKKSEVLGVVTRVSVAGEPICALVSGEYSGSIGELPGTAKMIHALDLKQIAWIWHPSGLEKPAVKTG